MPDGFDGFNNASRSSYLYHYDEAMFDYMDGAFQLSLESPALPLRNRRLVCCCSPARPALVWATGRCTPRACRD